MDRSAPRRAGDGDAQARLVVAAATLEDQRGLQQAVGDARAEFGRQLARQPLHHARHLLVAIGGRDHQRRGGDLPQLQIELLHGVVGRHPQLGLGQLIERRGVALVERRQLQRRMARRPHRRPQVEPRVRERLRRRAAGRDGALVALLHQPAHVLVRRARHHAARVVDHRFGVLPPRLLGRAARLKADEAVCLRQLDLMHVEAVRRRPHQPHHALAVPVDERDQPVGLTLAAA